MRPLLTATLAILAAATLPAQSKHRAILVSFDGFSEPWLRTYSDSTATPTLFRLFSSGVCAESVRPAMPSVTPTSHAAIWTGAYASVNGISASANQLTPWPEHTILETTDGYRAAALTAETIWLAAARQGRTVWSHMATQSPSSPAYPPVIRSTPALDSVRAVDAATNRRTNVAVVNIYNDKIEGPRIITEKSPLDWAFGKDGDSLHARIRDDSTVEVRLNRAARGVTVRLAPTDTTSPLHRPLARFFSKPLAVTLRDGRRTFVYFRLWELAHDRSKLTLFQSEARVIQANRPDVARAYDAAVQGVPGNGISNMMEHGELGTRVPDGGNGTAEFRYLETAELVTRQFVRGMEWGWQQYHPELATDYLPYPDETLHAFLGYADPSTPGVSAAGRANAAKMLRRGYELVELKLAQLERLAASTPNTRLFVTGEHGMRASWMNVRPNVALRAAGMLSADSAGRINLSKTRAYWAPGAWIIVNSVQHKDGIVPMDAVASVVDQAERVLRDIRDSTGMPVFRRFYRTGTVEGDSLGIGGGGGGDLYAGLRPGYYWNAGVTGPVIGPMSFPQGEHGFPSVDRDMHPLLCTLNAGPPHRIGEVRTIDIAPTISAWLGITPPRNATGHRLF
jgi:hypothetical protein